MHPDPLTVVQTQRNMPPGLLAAWARRRGVPIDVRRVDLGDRLPQPRNGVAILGSDASVNDASTPWLTDLRSWASEALDDGVPTFGIAFGAQLVAKLLGADVRSAPGAQSGWSEVTSTESWLAPGPWLTWNADVIVANDELAVVATDEHGLQAFTAGADERHVGVQFRPEATTATIAAWAIAAGLRTVDHRAALDARTADSTLAATAGAGLLFDHWALRAGLLQEAPVAVAA